MKPLLQVVNLSKSFGPLPVLQRVSFDVSPGEVVGLTGSIGLGKSVLMMILAGMYEPDEGEIYFHEKGMKWPFSAQSIGIGVIHQRPMLVDQLDVVSNIFLGNEVGWPMGRGPLRVMDEDYMIQKSMHILSQLGVQIDSLRTKVSALSIEQRQMVAIARVLTFPAKMYIIDEPTLFSYPNQQRLFGLIQSWREQGIPVLFSTNNLEHLFAVTDRVIVLHQTHIVADLRTDETSREAVVNLLLGAAVPELAGSTIWDYDSYNDFRKNAERLRYHQMLLEKDLAGEDSLNRQLARQLADQVQILDQVNTALLEAQRRLMTEREEERKHLAREIHDLVIQDLLSINYELEELELDLDPASPDSLADSLAEARQGIRALIESLRQICGNLRPLTIDSLGLGAALQSYTRDWAKRSGIRVELELDENLGRLPEASELSIFRIIQEGLNNVRRHARASQVIISLQHTTPRSLMISLRDNGRGVGEDFDLSELPTKGHYGLLGISERVTLLGGRFRIQRVLEGGLMLVIEIPHPRIEAEG